MKIAVAVLTYQQIEHHREGLFDQTLESLKTGGDDFLLYVVDNGSSDGTAEKVTKMGGFSCPGNTTSGHGTNMCAQIAVGSGADLCVLSDDDMVWKPGWTEDLRAWYEELPDDVVLTGCHLEEVYPWNTIRGKITSGGLNGLLRDSTGAASWSFRSRDWPKIGPVASKVQGTGDVPACHRLIGFGSKIAQIDLARHAGADHSIWGNGSERFARPLVREEWGL